MKKVTLVLFLICSSSTFSQNKALDSILNFKLYKNEIVWQKIFSKTDSLQIKELKEQLKSQEFTSNLIHNENNIVGRSNNYGKRLVKNSPYYATWGFDTYLKIEFKENRYRITAKDFLFRGPLLNVFGVQKQQDYPLIKNIVKRNKFKTNKNSKIVLQKLDSILDSKFTIQQHQKEDW